MFTKIIGLLSRRDRKSAAGLLLLMVVGMIFETFGVSLAIPIITLMLKPDIAEKYPQIEPALDLLGNPDRFQLALIGLSGLVGFYLVKNMFMGFLAWQQTRFSYGLLASLSERMFEFYMRQPYTFHLQRNSAKLIRNATGEVSLFANRIITPLLTLFTEFLVLVGVMTMLFLFAPLGATVVIAVLGGAGFAFYKLTREAVHHWGKDRQYHEGMRIQHLQQGIGGAKDVKVLGREEGFLDQFRVHNYSSARASQNQQFLQQLPRLWFEFLAVLGLSCLVIVMYMQGRQPDEILPLLGLFGAAAFRLMPSMNRILVAVQSIRFARPSVDTVFTEVRQATGGEVPMAAESPRTQGQAPEIVLEDVTYGYPETKSTALVGVNMAIAAGQTVGIIGPSGSGKSTLVDIVLGLLTPKSGRILVDRADIAEYLRAWQDRIGYVSQSIFLTDDTIRRNIAFGLPDDRIDDKAVMRALEAAQLAEFVAGLSNGWNTIVGERGVRLSGGQCQRIGIARALYHNPDVLLLDEATSALDNATEAGVMQAVYGLERNKTIIIVAHRLATVRNCDRIFRLEEGKVVGSGTPEEMIPTTPRVKHSG